MILVKIIPPYINYRFLIFLSQINLTYILNNINIFSVFLNPEKMGKIK